MTSPNRDLIVSALGEWDAFAQTLISMDRATLQKLKEAYAKQEEERLAFAERTNAPQNILDFQRRKVANLDNGLFFRVVDSVIEGIQRRDF